MFRKVVLLFVLTLLSSMLLLNVSYAQDTTPPTGSININSGAYWTRSASVVLSLTYSDEGSGVDKVRYTNANEWTNEPWEDPVSVRDWNLSSGDGIKYVSYQIRDKVGLTSTYYDSIILDNTLPTGTIVINDGAATTNSRSVTLKLTFSDVGAGVDMVRFTNSESGWGNEPWETPTTTKAWQLSEGEGIKYVSYQIRDKTGLLNKDTWDTITLEFGAAATPTFSPVGGTYTSVQTVTISCSTDGAIIRYTTDGSEPLATSTVYSSPIEVSSSIVIKAKAFKAEMDASATATATYAINLPAKVATPTFSPAGGTYTSVQTVTISCTTSGATIRYTTDGSEPSATSNAYSGPLAIDVTTTVKAKAFKDGMAESETATATYTVNLPVKISSPTFFPVAGTYTSVQTVTISCTTSGATIRYTTDGSEPSATSTVYLSPIEVGSSMMIKAKAFRDGMIDSDTATATYVMNIVSPSPDGGAVPVVYYAAIIIVVAAVVGVALLLLRRSKSRPSFKYTGKPKLKKG